MSEHGRSEKQGAGSREQKKLSNENHPRPPLGAKRTGGHKALPLCLQKNRATMLRWRGFSTSKKFLPSLERNLINRAGKKQQLPRIG
jgi:hypothetical protein